ncbi:hypothetical protein NBRGN_083_00140 [Nocardia brasiliensis NBRC 14402]|uniref:hypothetical protein n=1 Tax=Nocardia brasiliensis TaxID=37326 RepID=UPI000316573D|nr:hypothetical protein [Nocardia brasiliensis]AVL26546.1 hypothetical protein CEQ30_38760 [Nocardia brasiliensis]GAJ85102.1 hypothetical protein NBRGN_083_00140 [Nocardia brasiliensis NBRC 14402]SUB53258.1 Uncharacterised protein [Nocardia brasiliensis]
MLMRNLAATATMLIAALGVAAGTAAADPAAADAPINFTAESTDTQAIVSLDAGSIVVEDGALKIKAANGNVVAGTPLKFRLDEFEFPIAADIAGCTATLTPQLDMSKAVYKPVALPFEDKAPWKSEYDREQAAWSRMTGTISLGASIATLVGGLGGAAVGCVLGGIVGGAVVGGTIVGLFGPFLGGIAAGCLGGAAAMGALGTVAGQIFITAPVAIGAAIQYFTTINQPFNPAK